MLDPYYENEYGVIYCGDCLEVLPLMPSKSVDLVVTSPPYNLIREWSGGGPKSKMKSIEERFYNNPLYADQKKEKVYQAEQIRMLKECMRICTGSVYYNHKVRYAWKRRNCIYHPLDWLRQFPIWTEIIWDRRGGPGGNSKRWRIAEERIYQIGGPKAWHKLPYTNIWTMLPDINAEHPATFPIELPRRCILSSTDIGDTVLDPYVGSGTSVLAAILNGRKGIGIEIEEKYCEIAAKRLEQYKTGLTPAEQEQGQQLLFDEEGQC